ncbi:MAG: hypothetical protein QM820_29570 [Minicystis sp.]
MSAPFEAAGRWPRRRSLLRAQGTSRLRPHPGFADRSRPAEAFLPQVSVQASCVFLRRRYASELQMLGKDGPKQRPVFMAVAEKCGHGRRGEVTWVRKPDGSELIETKTVVERREREGKIEERTRQVEGKRLADDMPWVVDEFRRLKANGSLGEA